MACTESLLQTDFVSYCLPTQHFPAQQAELGICTAGNMQPLLRVVSPPVLTGAYEPQETVQGAMRKTQCLATTAKLQSPAVRDIMLQSQGVQSEPTFSKEQGALGSRENAWHSSQGEKKG